MESISLFLDHAIQVLGLPMVMTVGAFLFDLVLRLVKTEKPRTIIYAIPVVLMAFAKIVGKLSELSMKLADLLNKVLPQRVAAEVSSA